MIANCYIKIFSFVNLGRRYFRRQKSDLQAISRKRAKFYARAWEDAAAQTGSSIEALGSGFFRIFNGSNSILVFEQYTQLVDRVTERLIVDKSIANRLLSDMGVPTPKSISLKGSDPTSARSFMSEVGGPVVVKPSSGTGGGDGVTTNITSTKRLLDAIAWSRAFSSEYVLEEQIKGDNYRLLFLDGALLDCIIRRPPSITGDGVSSIRRLILRENEMRLTSEIQLAQSLITMDLDMNNTLAAEGMSLRTIPEKGEVVKVKEVINCNRAEENESPAEHPAPSIIAMGRKISETFGVRLVGIDIITDDLTKDLAETGGIVIEINTPPGHFYHQLKKGKGFPVALHLLEHAFSLNRSGALN